MTMDFLPGWPPRFNELLLFSLLLAAGIFGGHLAGRTRYLPRITGYIAAGFVLGPGVTGLLTPGLLADARLFTDIALGLILYDLGRQLDLRALRANRWLLGAGLLESGLSFVLVWVALRLAGLNMLNAGMVAALGISSSPAVILLVIRQLNARGPVTESAITLVALNNVLAYFMFLTALPVLHIEQHAGILTIVLQPLYQLGVSLIVAGLLAKLMSWAARHLGQHENVQFALTIGAIIGAIGLSKMFNVSALLPLLGLGILANFLDREQRLLQVDFGFGGELFFLMLFVVAGANLHLEELGRAGLLAMLFVAVRQVAKSSATFGMLRASGLDTPRAALVGLTLAPMAGLAIGLSELTYDLYPQFGQELRTLVLASIAILETVGPIVTEYALRRAGEVQNDLRLHH